MTRTFGALPPSGAEWQLGKTPASIRFVTEAEELKARLEGNPDAIAKLDEVIQEIMAFSRALKKFLDPEKYIQNPSIIDEHSATYEELEMIKRFAKIRGYLKE